jgi:hypothetical protein
MPHEQNNMGSSKWNVVQAVAATDSVLVALVAIWLTYLSVQIQHEATRLQRETAVASVKPFLYSVRLRYENLRGVKLINGGIGPAVVTKIIIRRGDHEVRNAADLFSFERQFAWDTFRVFGRRTVIAPKEEVPLLELSLNGLTAQNMSEPDALAILSFFRDQLRGLSIYCEYEDALGNEQKPLKVTY